MTPVLIHVLSLDTIGGVETLYSHFLEKALSTQSAIHYTAVSGKRPHTKFLAQFEKIGHSPFLEEYVMGMRLPKLLRSFVAIRRGMVHDIANPTFWIYWNRIEHTIPSGEAIYYEHGAAWNVAPSKKRLAFLHHCSPIVAISQAAVTMLKEKWHVKDPIHVVPNPLRPDIALASCPRSCPSKQPLRLGFIGRLVPVKGVFVALHTLKALIDRGLDATLTIAGVGQLEGAVRQAAQKLGIAPRLHWRGSVAVIRDFYDSIDLLLVPSLREPLGLVAVEAAACGVPVIASAVDGLPEAVLDGKTGRCILPTIPLSGAKELVPSTDGIPEVVVNPTAQRLEAPKVLNPAEAADAIELLIKDPVVYNQYSINAIDYARTRSDFCLYFNSLKNIFETVPAAT